MTFTEKYLQAPGGAAMSGSMGAEPGRAGDFDFFVGSWDSRQRRLREPLAGCDEWYEFPATTRCWSLFDGAANMDVLSAPDQGFTGLTVRLLDPASGDWSLYWVSSRTGVLALPPVVGRFRDGVGRFYSEEDYHGQRIICRYTWSGITPESARWDQAFSVDGGQTWETNWIAEFTRREADG